MFSSIFFLNIPVRSVLIFFFVFLIISNEVCSNFCSVIETRCVLHPMALYFVSCYVIILFCSRTTVGWLVRVSRRSLYTQPILNGWWKWLIKTKDSWDNNASTVYGSATATTTKPLPNAVLTLFGLDLGWMGVVWCGEYFLWGNQTVLHSLSCEEIL